MSDLRVKATVELLVPYDDAGDDDRPLEERVRREGEAANAAGLELVEGGYPGAELLEAEVVE